MLDREDDRDRGGEEPPSEEEEVNVGEGGAFRLDDDEVDEVGFSAGIDEEEEEGGGAAEPDRLSVIERGLGLGLEEEVTEVVIVDESPFSFLAILAREDEEEVEVTTEEESVFRRLEASGLVDEEASSRSFLLIPFGEAVDLLNPSSFLTLLPLAAPFFSFFSFSFSLSAASSFSFFAFAFAAFSFSFSPSFLPVVFFFLLPLPLPLVPVESAGLGPLAGGIGLASLLRLLGTIFGLGTRLARSGASRGSPSSS
jgi:hypothetical protein